MRPSILSLRLRAFDANGRSRSLSDGFRIGGTATVVPRSACRFERVWLPRTDEKGRRAARLQIEMDAPFKVAGSFIGAPGQEGSGFLNAWLWDDVWAGGAGPSDDELLVPETYALEPARGDEARLVKCLEGFEGQIWSEGDLIASRWWNNQPRDVDWREFVEGVAASVGGPSGAIDAYRSAPAVTEPSWRDDLTVADFGFDALSRMATPTRLFFASALVLAFPLTMSATELAALLVHNREHAREIALLEDNVADVFAARDSALAARAKVESLVGLGDPQQLSRALTHLNEAFEEEVIEIYHISLRDDEIEVKLSGAPVTPPPVLIERLENQLYWREVSTSVDATGDLVIRGVLGPRGDRNG